MNIFSSPHKDGLRLSGERKALWAHVLPFLLFMAFVELPKAFKIPNQNLEWWEHSPEQWVFPLQTLLVGAAMLYFWRHYRFAPHRGWVLATVLAAVGILAWIIPNWLYFRMGVADWEQIEFGLLMITSDETVVWEYLGLHARDEGFDPWIFQENSLVTFGVIFMRFVRMVLVVAFVEEIFWRGFLMRFVVNPDRWQKVKFGTHSWPAFFISTIAFTLVHHHVDWLACLVYGSLTYWLAIRTKSLSACILMHAVANLLLGLYTMGTGRLGFW